MKEWLAKAIKEDGSMRAKGRLMRKRRKKLFLINNVPYVLFLKGKKGPLKVLGVVIIHHVFSVHGYNGYDHMQN